MTPASLFAAVALAVPTPMQLMEAHALVRCPDVPAAVAERDRAALVLVGTRLELIAPGELGYLPVEEWAFGDPDAATLLVLLRDLYAELRDAPPLSEGERLPPAAACYSAATFNGRVADHFRKRALWEPDRDVVLTAAAAECEAYQEFWQMAAAASSGYSVADRRRSLAYLRGVVGRDNWSAGRLPDFAPAHLFHAR